MKLLSSAAAGLLSTPAFLWCRNNRCISIVVFGVINKRPVPSTTSKGHLRGAWVGEERVLALVSFVVMMAVSTNVAELDLDRDRFVIHRLGIGWIKRSGFVDQVLEVVGGLADVVEEVNAVISGVVGFGEKVLIVQTKDFGWVGLIIVS